MQWEKDKKFIVLFHDTLNMYSTTVNSYTSVISGFKNEWKTKHNIAEELTWKQLPNTKCSESMKCDLNVMINDKSTFKSISETTKIKVPVISISTKWLSIMLYSQTPEKSLSICDFKTREMKTSKIVKALGKERITDNWLKHCREKPHSTWQPIELVTKHQLLLRVWRISLQDNNSYQLNKIPTTALRSKLVKH